MELGLPEASGFKRKESKNLALLTRKDIFATRPFFSYQTIFIGFHR